MNRSILSGSHAQFWATKVSIAIKWYDPLYRQYIASIPAIDNIKISHIFRDNFLYEN